MPNDLTFKARTSRHEVAHQKERPGSSLSMHATSFSVLFIMVLMLSSSLEIFSQISNSPLQNNTIRLSRFKFKSTSSQNSTNAYSKKQQTVSDINEISSKLTIPLLNRKQKTRSQSKKHKTTKKTIDNKDLIGLFKKTFMSLVGSNEILVSKYSESKVPAYIMDLYKQSDTKHTWRAANRRIKNGWFAGDTIRSFMPDTQRKLDSHNAGKRFLKEKYIFKFNTSHIPENERDKGSELRVFYTPSITKRHLNSQHLYKYFYAQEKIYVYLIDTRKNNQHILLDKKRIDRLVPQWVTLNVSQVFEKFNDRTELTFKIVLRSSQKQRQKRSTLNKKAPESLAINDANHTPLLVTYSDSQNQDYSQQFHKKQRRRKKWTKHYNSPSHRQSAKRRQNNQCRRRKFYVGFEMLGWDDWIVAPNGYEAYFCQGYCPTFMPDYLNATNHATIQSLMHSRNPKQIPRPCCVPTKLEPLTLLYLAQRKGYIIKEYPNMVVLGCGCR